MIDSVASFLAPRPMAVVLMLLVTWACARVVRSVAVFYWCVWLAGLASVGALLDSRMEDRLPGMLAGLGLFAGCWWLGDYWSRSVLIWMSNDEIPYPWRWSAALRIAVVSAGIALASESTGFATPLIRNAFLILLAGATLTLAYAVSPLLRVLWSTSHATARRQSDDSLSR